MPHNKRNEEKIFLFILALRIANLLMNENLQIRLSDVMGDCEIKENKFSFVFQKICKIFS